MISYLIQCIRWKVQEYHELEKDHIYIGQFYKYMYISDDVSAEKEMQSILEVGHCHFKVQSCSESTNSERSSRAMWIQTDFSATQVQWYECLWKSDCLFLLRVIHFCCTVTVWKILPSTSSTSVGRPYFLTVATSNAKWILLRISPDIRALWHHVHHTVDLSRREHLHNTCGGNLETPEGVIFR